jgi:secondary thiamine-phosphate synthase enzyme
MVLTVTTRNRTELIDITAAVRQAVAASGVREGLCWVSAPHTTAGITLNEAADPSVAADLLMVLNRMVPSEADYRHREGNSPAHVKSTLVGASHAVAVENGDLVLGTWQGVFFCEFDGPRRRSVEVRVLAGKFK